jgi:hypothetical protein
MDINLPLRPSLIRNDKPWMTEEIKELIIDRQRLFHTNESELKELAKRVKVLIEKRKEEYYGQLGNKNPKELWQRINEHRSNTKQEIIKFTPTTLVKGSKAFGMELSPKIYLNSPRHLPTHHITSSPHTW